MTFRKWFETFIDEKEIDLERSFDFEIGGQFHIMPVGVVVEFVRDSLTVQEQAQVKMTLVKIDFKNGDVYHFFEYLAKGIAQMFGEW